MKTSLLKPLLAATFALGLLAPSLPAAGQAAQRPSYEKLLADVTARPEVATPDQVREVLALFGAGAHGGVEPGTVAAELRRSWPEPVARAPVMIPAEVRQRLIPEGKNVEKMAGAITPLLKFARLEGRVRPFLFRSEVPITFFVYPNALFVSTRALALLDAEELEAQVAHEVTHLVGQALYRRAVDGGDDRTRRLLELFCDAGGAAIITAKGGNARKLVSGLEKMASVLEVEFGEYQRGTKHPTMKARRQLNDALVGEFKRAALAAAAAK
jgi:hypothetical protein